VRCTSADPAGGKMDAGAFAVDGYGDGHVDDFELVDGVDGDGDRARTALRLHAPDRRDSSPDSYKLLVLCVCKP
jgi:hypothetical protein